MVLDLNQLQLLMGMMLVLVLPVTGADGDAR